LTPLCFRDSLSILPNGAPKAHHAPREDAKRLALAASLLIEEQPA
jgi:hypothetical protein